MGLEIVSGGGLSLFMDEIISKHWSHHHHILILSHTSPHSSKLMSLLSPQADTGSSVYWHQSYNIMKMLESADVSAINLSINIESGQQTMGIWTMCACLATLPMYWHERCVVCTEHRHPQPRAWLLTCDSGDWTRVCTRRDYTNCHKLHEIDPISIFSASMHMLSLTWKHPYQSTEKTRIFA